MVETEDVNFLDYFKDIEDPRSERNQLHSVSEIFLVTLCAVVCGAEGWQDVEDYGRLKLEFLRNYLPYKNGVPSDDTLRRFFRAIDPEGFKERFVLWVKDFQELPAESIISIDGKTSRHSFDTDKAALHLMSAFASEARIVLGQEKVSDKSNEITAIPRLLEWLDLRGAIVTIDAMGCQHKIAEKIKGKKGEYVLALKGNQSTLHEDIRLFFEDEVLLRSGIESYETVDGAHGRIEMRRCSVTSKIEWLKENHPEWRSVQSIIKIESIREVKDQSTKEVRYYISSLAADAKKILRVVRSHWAIENSLHWVLDMSFGEDQSRIRKKNAPENMAIMRHVALNLLQAAKLKRQSIKRLRKMAGWDNPTLQRILNTQTFS
jgi:predicted transposase YbfD/YdcC